jgi:hypothetical protein
MKHVRVLIAAFLVVPAVLSAQQPAAPPPANPITQAFKASGAQYARWLTAAFDSIPADKYNYKPTPVQLTIGYVAQHLEGANYQLCGNFGGAKYTMTARDSLADTIKAKWPKDTLTARLKASFAFCDNAMNTLDDAKLSDQVQVGPASAPRMVPRARYVLGYVTDLVDHWSQIANYMRLNGLVPPSALPRPGARGGE